MVALSDRPDVWRSKDGRETAIVAMTDQHLINTIRFLRRNVLHYQIAQFSDMGRYIADAPDGAAAACQSEVDYLMDLPDEEYLKVRFPCFRTMLAEAARRNLSI